MELDIKRIPEQASRCTVIKAIARILHSEDFRRSPEPDERPANFQVKLNESKLGGVRNNGSGVLTLMPELGRRFWKYTATTPVLVDGQKLKFFITDRKPPPGLAMTLEKAPYIDPDQEEERQGKLYELQEQLRVEEVQFGVFYRSYPKLQNNKVQSRSFSVECTRNYASKSLGWLHFDYDHKLIYIEVLWT
jgi:RNA-dependent RNA polymerase